MTSGFVVLVWVEGFKFGVLGIRVKVLRAIYALRVGVWLFVIACVYDLGFGGVAMHILNPERN